MEKLTKNILFSYLYRDASNYKLMGNAIFTNPEKLSLFEIEEKIKAGVDEGNFFIPQLLGLSKPAFDDFDSKLDHEWCEYCRVEYTTEESNLRKTINSLLTEIELLEKESNRSSIF